jgi:hypothetical protein
MKGRISFPGAAALRKLLQNDGIAVVTVDNFPELARVAELAPWRAVEHLLGGGVLMAEQQTIRVVPGGDTFSSGNMEAPPHTDSQLFLGAPPDVQVMMCIQPADVGGESVFVDTWAMLERMAAAGSALLDSLFTVPRRIPLVYGDHHGPTVTAWRGRVFFTHVSKVMEDDIISIQLAQWVESQPPIRWKSEPGDILLIDNHRMLHGRTAFSGESRRFQRVLGWLTEGLGVHPRFSVLTSEGGLALEDDPASQRLEAVLGMLRGASPGITSTEMDVAEAELYRQREVALDAARNALRNDLMNPPSSVKGLRRWLRRWLG